MQSSASLQFCHFPLPLRLVVSSIPFSLSRIRTRITISVAPSPPLVQRRGTDLIGGTRRGRLTIALQHWGEIRDLACSIFQIGLIVISNSYATSISGWPCIVKYADCTTGGYSISPPIHLEFKFVSSAEQRPRQSGARGVDSNLPKLI